MLLTMKEARKNTMNNAFKRRFSVQSITATICVMAALCIVAASAEARVYAPRVVSPHRADVYSMKTFAKFARWRNLKGDAKARAVYEYLTDRRSGLYPLGAGAWEGKDTTYEFGLVRDPVKMINGYSLGFCDVFGPVMAGIWQESGFGKARTVDLPDMSHVAAEVFYDDKWHYLDLDLRGAFFRGDGTLASLEEARKNASLWKKQHGPRFFPMDDLTKLRESFIKSAVRHRHAVHTSGHTMDYVLRQGETLTRWWKPQGDRWHDHKSYREQPSLRKLIEAKPRGPKSKHADFTIHIYGNGRFVYEPNLTEKSTDFGDGVYSVDNVKPGKEGVTVDKQGEGYATFEVRSPYIIVPLVPPYQDNNTKNPADKKKSAAKQKKAKKAEKPKPKEASVLELNATKGTIIEVSIDNAATWIPIKVEKFPTVVDLSEYVAGRYSYLLKLTLKGKPDEAIVRSLKLTTWVQLAPAALPALASGKNQMAFRTGDHYGLQTRVVEIRPNAANDIDFLKYVVLPPNEYDPKSRSSRIKGSFVVRVSAPPNAKVAWFSAGGSFQTHQKENARKTNSSVAYAVGSPENFVEFYRANVPLDNEHWHYNADREVRLEQPTENVYVRYTGDPAINNIRIYAHCLDDQPAKSSRVQVKHVWSEDGQSKNFETTLDADGQYNVNVAGNPVNESIEIAVPSHITK